jgi:hypothetical protein
MFTLSLVRLCAELEDVRYVIDGDSYPEYEVKSLHRGESIKQGEEVEVMYYDKWYRGVVNKIKSSSMTTSEVVRDIIIPETAARGCCYADIFPGGPKPPETLMSHWWGNSFINLVKVMMNDDDNDDDVDER